MNNCLNCVYSQATRVEPYKWEVECMIGETDLEKPYCNKWTHSMPAGWTPTETSETSEK